LGTGEKKFEFVVSGHHCSVDLAAETADATQFVPQKSLQRRRGVTIHARRFTLPSRRRTLVRTFNEGNVITINLLTLSAD